MNDAIIDVKNVSMRFNLMEEKVDTLKEPPMFRVTDTHYAKTWLLDPRAPKVEKPEAIRDIHEKLIKAFNI